MASCTEAYFLAFFFPKFNSFYLASDFVVFCLPQHAKIPDSIRGLTSGMAVEMVRKTWNQLEEFIFESYALLKEKEIVVG